jgi:UDP-N-acetylmuramyl pentapeptide phosphotransferase/UDP-N-acetylglucosamine-1-phosphate transferase
MIYLLISFLSCFFITYFLIRYQHIHLKFSADSQSGPQKIHLKATSRVGGIGIFIGLILGLGLKDLLDNENLGVTTLIPVLCLPAFGVGLIEDITKKVSPRIRLFIIVVGGLCSLYFLDTQISSVGIWGLDFLLSFTFISLIFSVFAITGLANAYNIIDGFNGLASMVGVIALLAIAYIGFKVNDNLVVFLSFAMVASILGFFLWNYPKGLIFLGDGGAYLIGFWIALLSILLVANNSTVSPWFALFVNAYPILETGFSIWRRKIHRGHHSMMPDGIHFHTLIYRRIVKGAHIPRSQNERYIGNARTSPYLWFFSSISVVPAVLFWDNTLALIVSTISYVILYVYAYFRIVRFKK